MPLCASRSTSASSPPKTSAGWAFLAGRKSFSTPTWILNSVAPEPPAAPGGERRGLRQDLEAEDAGVEGLGPGLSALGDGDLNVIETLDDEGRAHRIDLNPAPGAPRIARQSALTRGPLQWTRAEQTF